MQTSTADGSKTLYSERYGQTMRSHRGAVTESKHVFLEGSGVAERLRRHERTRVLEVGFGTGLNFFLTADLALLTGTSLHYAALEHELLDAQTVRGLGYEAYLEHQGMPKAFLEARERLPERRGRYLFEVAKGVRLELRLGNATKEDLGSSYNAVYLDAFSPEANPELWSEAFLRKLHAALSEDGVLSTYCVKGEVRRRMGALGFAVTKRPGPPGGKREMLVASKPVRSKPL